MPCLPSWLVLVDHRISVYWSAPAVQINILRQGVELKRLTQARQVESAVEFIQQAWRRALKRRASSVP